MVNKAVFDALDPDVQESVLAAAATAETRGWAMSREETEAKTAELVANGMNVITPSDELLDGLRNIGDQMQTSWQESASDEAKAIAEAFNQ